MLVLDTMVKCRSHHSWSKVFSCDAHSKGFLEISCCTYTALLQFIPISICAWSLDSRNSRNVFNQNMFDEKWAFDKN